MKLHKIFIIGGPNISNLSRWIYKFGELIFKRPLKEYYSKRNC